MVYRKGERTNKQREAEYSFAVDIPIPRTGLGQHLNRIAEAASLVGGEQWSYSTRDERGNPLYWCRVGVKDELDAERLVRMFAGLGRSADADGGVGREARKAGLLFWRTGSGALRRAGSYRPLEQGADEGAPLRPGSTRSAPRAAGVSAVR